MITTAAELEACIGATPAAVNLKVIDHLDVEAGRWLGASALAFAAGVQAQGVSVTIAGAAPGFARVLGPNKLALPLDTIDDPAVLRPGHGAGLLFLVSGIGETLRVNGRVALKTADFVELDVEEVYVHCAKSLLRSAFWSAAPATASTEPAEFLRAARFAAVASADAEGHADLSPKGDPAGNMLRLGEQGVSYAERPGNKRADSLRNMLTQPQVAALALIPGSTNVVIVHGHARLLTDAADCAPFAVDGKTPKLVTLIAEASLSLRESAALSRAAPWPLRMTEHGIDPARVVVAHVKLNKSGGMAAALLRKAATKTMINLGLKLDYKHKLY